MQPIFLALILGAVSVSAKTVHQAPGPILPVVPVEDTILNDGVYQKLLKETKDPSRKLAQSATDMPADAIESKLSTDKEFIAIREALIGNGSDKPGVVTVQDLDRVIKTYSDPNYPGYIKVSSDQALFVVLQLKSLAPFKSAIFRLKEYVKKYDAIRVYIVSILRAQIAGIQNFFPVTGASGVNRWEVVYKYITEPTPDMDYPVTDDAHLYSFFTSITYAMGTINNEFSHLVDRVRTGEKIWWDNKLFMSFASFTSEKDRYVHLGDPELNALYAATSLNVSFLDTLTAYSLDGFQDAIRDIGHLFGIQNTTWTITGLQSIVNGPEGLSSMSRTSVLNAHPNLFVKVKDGDLRMSSAYDALAAAAFHAQLAFEHTKALKDGQDSLFDPSVALGFNRIGTQAFQNIFDLVRNGKEAESIVVNNEKVRVNISGFYHAAPARLSDLYPQDWVTSPEYYDVTAWGKRDKLRNYKFGMATTWKYDAYKVLFPDITEDKGKTKDVAKFTRILSQTWGSAIFALPLSLLIY